MIELNDSIEGETIEQKVMRITENNEPITDGAPIIFTARKDGVLPAYDVRTDRFEIAIDGMDYVAKSNLARRKDYLNALENDLKDGDSGETPANTSDNQPE
nr:MAG: hypothetical protein [Microvirus sp.]